MSCGGSKCTLWFNNSTFRTVCSDRLQENAPLLCFTANMFFNLLRAQRETKMKFLMNYMFRH